MTAFKLINCHIKFHRPSSCAIRRRLTSVDFARAVVLAMELDAVADNPLQPGRSLASQLFSQLLPLIEAEHGPPKWGRSAYAILSEELIGVSDDVVEGVTVDPTQNATAQFVWLSTLVLGNTIRKVNAIKEERNTAIKLTKFWCEHSGAKLVDALKKCNNSARGPNCNCHFCFRACVGLGHNPGGCRDPCTFEPAYRVLLEKHGLVLMRTLVDCGQGEDYFYDDYEDGDTEICKAWVKKYPWYDYEAGHGLRWSGTAFLATTACPSMIDGEKGENAHIWCLVDNGESIKSPGPISWTCLGERLWGAHSVDDPELKKLAALFADLKE